MLHHRWFAFRRNDVDKLPASVSRVKNYFRTAAVVLQV
jgi:hypothetical protein